MSKIVFNTIGSHGDIYPYLAIAKELKNRGHAPLIATATYYMEEIERAGIGFAPCRPEIEPDNIELIEKLTDPIRGSEFIVKEMVIPNLRDSYADLSRAMQGADLLVSHVLTYGAPIYGEKFNVPWVSTVLSPMIFCSAYEVPAFPQLPALAHIRKLGPKASALFLKYLKKVSWGWTQPIRAFKKELGLPHDSDPLWEGQHSPHKVLALFSKEFGAPQPDWPKNTVVCGFPFHDQEGISDPEELKKFLKVNKAPLVFSLGSTAVKVSGNFYHEALDAVKKLNVPAVLLAGEDCEKLNAKGLPPHVVAVPWADYHHLFPKAGAIIHSGGAGTTSQALRAGVPQLVVPFANDQFDNADRVCRMGAGISMRRGGLTADLLCRKLKILRNNKTIQARTEAIAQLIQIENGPLKAALEIESLIQ